MRRFILRPLGWLLGGLFVLTFVLVSGSLGYRSYKQAQIRSAIHIEAPNGIESLELVSLNGLDQWVKLRGHDVDNPVLLFLHGGPGMPELPVSHLSDLELEKHFTVVHWDQRAAGKTRRQGFDEADLRVPVFVDDALALVGHLQARFNKDKIYLVGHSWGTMMGTLAVRDHPELFHAYVGMGQLTNLTDNEVVGLEYVRRRAREEGNAKALAELEGLHPPYSDNIDEMSIQRKWLYMYGGGLRGLGFDDLFLAYFTSPDYSLLDLFAMSQSIASAAVMWPEMAEYDFLTDALKFDVPVYFFAGRHDYNTPSVLAEKYMELLDAPHKEMVWFENSAHLMNASDPDHYQDMLINKVLKDTRGR